MDGDVHVHRVMDQLQAIIDTAQGALDEMAVAFNPVDVSEFDATTGGEFAPDTHEQNVPDGYAENKWGLPVDYCPRKDMHSPHDWAKQPDVDAHLFCPGMPF